MGDSNLLEVGIIIENKQFKILCLQKTVLSFVHENFKSDYPWLLCALYLICCLNLLF